MNQDNSESLAVTISSTIFAVIAVIVAPEISDLGFFGQSLAVILGATTIGTFFLFLRRTFHRVWAKPILGQWIYKTERHDGTNPSFGVALFDQAWDGSLSYRVDLFLSEADAYTAAIASAPVTTSYGTAVGHAISFNEQSGSLWILYGVEYYASDEPDREGHLMVRASGPVGARVLRGSWASDLNGKLLSAGVMTVFRPQDFASHFEVGGAASKSA